MAQWDPKATSYTYAASMNSGIYCNSDGAASKPFVSRPYCMKGVSNVGMKDSTGKGCTVCQTVLPGSESMLIPTTIEGWSEIIVPGTDYWYAAAAQCVNHDPQATAPTKSDSFYINPPGMSTEDGCVWVTAAKPQGRWSPYVAGPIQDGSGNNFVKIAVTPKYRW